jgi:glucose uptake protein GlcU
MKKEDKKGSVITGVFIALIFFLIIAVFGKSVRDANANKQNYKNLSVGIESQYAIRAGYSNLSILKDAEQIFVPTWSSSY